MRRSQDRLLYPTSANLKCVVCGEDAGVFAVKDEPVCIRAECKHVIARKKEMNPAAYQQFFNLQSRQIRLTIEQAKKKKKALEEKLKKEQQDYIEFIKQQVKKKLNIDPERFSYVMISRNSRPIVSLSKKRKDLFGAFLSNLVAKTISDMHNPDSFNNKESSETFETMAPLPVEAKACAACAGTCCTTGEENAYLKKETIARYLAQYPNHAQTRIVETYMTYLADTSYENACVYHKETGCRLPRRFRSDTCNEFKCDALISINKILNASPETKEIILIERMPDNWRTAIANRIDDRLFSNLVYFVPV